MPTINELIAAEKKKEESQPRDHAVKCIKLCGRETWNHDAICDGCKESNETKA